MFFYGWAGYKPMRRVPADAMVIKAHGQMWSWSFEYDNGKRSQNMVIPVNKPIKVDLVSHDVIHSLYIPAYRLKEDVVPGKNNWMWFKGEKTDTFDIFCSEYCGQRHSYMLSKLIVLPQADYEKWYNEELGITTDPPGLALLKQNACLSCHSTDGTVLVGPSFKGLYGKIEIVLTNNQERKIKVDDDYIRKSIMEPNADITKGFRSGLMPDFKDRVHDEDITKIIDFLKTLQ
jgi:cytochrome c oxidase subunit 2